MVRTTLCCISACNDSKCSYWMEIGKRLPCTGMQAGQEYCLASPLHLLFAILLPFLPYCKICFLLAAPSGWQERRSGEIPGVVGTEPYYVLALVQIDQEEMASSFPVLFCLQAQGKPSCCCTWGPAVLLLARSQTLWFRQGAVKSKAVGQEAVVSGGVFASRRCRY